jgi:peroxiredoxin
LSWPFHHRRSGGFEAGRRRARFHVDAAQGGKEFKFSLAEALKKGPVVLYFYPKSFSNVRTIEARPPARPSLAFRATRSRCNATFR